MCYTSGTTGNPKGVVYSHRSIVLHSLTLTQTDIGGPLRARLRDALRADVPCQRLGAGACGAAGGREPGLPRAADGPSERGQADGRPSV